MKIIIVGHHIVAKQEPKGIIVTIAPLRKDLFFHAQKLQKKRRENK